MTSSLRDVPIKRKLMLVVLLTTTFALLLMCAALIIYEVLTFRRELTTNTGVLAQIVGSNSAAALAFDNPEDADQSLSALAAEKQISAAALYDTAGNLFAHFPPDVSATEFPARPGADGHEYRMDHLLMFHPVTEGGKRQGTIYLQADLGQMFERIRVYGVLVLIVGACSIAAALVFSTTLQRRISVPIVELAGAARAVSERQDYAVRAVKHGTDEIGDLTDAFNQMLTRIGETTAALSASEERLRLALEGSQMGTWDWDLVANRLSWDDYMFPLLGVKRETFEGTPGSSYQNMHPDDRARVQQVTRDALEHRENLSVDFRVIAPDGTIRHMASRGRAFYDSSGRPVRMNGVSMDVTQSKETEEALKHAKEAAEAANNAKDNFLAILSHELRTPLTPVLATVAMLEDEGNAPVHLRRELETIRRNVEVEARLIDDLLDVTRIARGKLELHRQQADVHSLLEHAVQTYLMGEATTKNLRVSMQVRAGATQLSVDSSRITQVFWNLFQNACKFTPEGGGISISVFNEKGQRAPALQDGDTPNATELVIEIGDTGIGVDAEVLPRIFDAFEQGERSRTRVFGGLGLGLAISRAIIELHGGTLTAWSEGRDKGTKFTIRLPNATDAVVTPHGIRDPVNAPAPLPAARSLRILLVEDHPDTARQLQRLLERAGYEVTLASSVREALAAAAGKDKLTPFELLISDLGLPDGTGHHVMRELSSLYGVPGIALSGYGMEADVQESLAAGFLRHFTKPVDWVELKATIRKLAAAISPTP